MNYYERHLGDYAKDTSHLSMLEHGAYTLLLDRYYSKEAPIPHSEVYRICRARTNAERLAVEAVLAEFFVREGNAWSKGRCDEEIERAHARISAARNNGQKGGRPKAKSNPPETHRDTQQEPSGFSLGNPAVTQPLTQSKALQTPDSRLQDPRAASRPVDPDPRKQLFDLGKSILGASSGGLISSAISRTDEATVGRVLGEMALSTKADPRGYFIAATTPKERALVC